MHKLRKGEWTRGNARAKGANWTKFTEIRTKFVRNSYEFHISRKFTQIYSGEIRRKFVRISYEFHVNFVQFANTQSKHTSKHTLHSHGQVMLHAPVLAHLGDRHARTVFTRCHGVVGRPGGAMPDMAKWISDSASTLSPLHTSSWCTLPMKNSVPCSPTSMTARSEAGADREMKVGWKGQVGGACRDRLGGGRRRGPGQPPPPTTPPSQPPPSPPTTPGPRWGSPSWTNPKQRPGPPWGGWRPSVWCWAGGVCVGGPGSTS